MRNMYLYIGRMAFSYYSWISTIGWKIMDIMPPFIRNIIFKLCLGKIGKRCNIDYGVYLRYMKQVEIGDDVWINRNSHFFASHSRKDVKISIGNHVAIGPNVYFFAAGHDTSTLDLKDTAGSITVGDNVWICGDSVILQGVTIGEGAVIAAGAVVSHDVKPFTIVGGVPAKVLKDRIIKQNH